MMARTTNPSDVTPGTQGGTVVGLFTDRADAEHAIRQLRDAGFTEKQIGLAMRDRDEQRKLMEDTGSTAAEGAAVGAVSGGVLGGLIGLLGSLLIPGIGPIVAGGVLASTLAGAGIGAAAGGIIGALMGLGVPEADAQHFDRGLRSGGVIVTVDAGDRVGEAIAILQHNHVDLGPSGIERFRTAAGVGAPGANLEDEQRLKLREEQLDIEKEQVRAGEVRVRKEVVTEQKSFDVPVNREEVVIERRPAAEVEASGTPIGDDKEIRIPLSEERVNVEKRPVVREEIDVGKRTVRDTERVADSVRREEARIETEGKASVRSAGAGTPFRGKERRRRRDTSYAGPERREAQL